MQTPEFMRRSIAALALALCLGGCSAWDAKWRESKLIFESGSGPAEVWINGVHVGDAPLELDMLQLYGFFAPELEELTRSPEAMSRAAAGPGQAGIDQGLNWSSGGGTFGDGSYVMYAGVPSTEGPDPIEYVFLFRELSVDSGSAGPISGGLRVSLRAPDGRWFRDVSISSRSVNGVTTKRFIFALR